MKKWRLLLGELLIGCCLIVTAISSQAAAYKNVVFFGDSLSDTGNNTWVAIDGYSRRGAPITNGHKIWPNFLTNHPGLISTRELYLYQAHRNPAVDNINYAYASAETGDRYIDDTTDGAYPPYNTSCQAPGIGCVPGVMNQIDFFIQDLQGQTPNPKTLFIIWAGGNDIFNNVAKILTKNSPVTRQQLRSLQAMARGELTDKSLSNPIANLRHAVTKLIKHGVRRQQIYVFNLPDLSIAPAAKSYPTYLLRGITMAYNGDLAAALYAGGPVVSSRRPWRFQLPRGHVYSAYKEMNQVLAKSQFTNKIDSCIAAGALPECTGYFFFNDKHPSQTVGPLIGADVAQYLQAIYSLSAEKDYNKT